MISFFLGKSFTSKYFKLTHPYSFSQFICIMVVLTLSMKLSSSICWWFELMHVLSFPFSPSKDKNSVVPTITVLVLYY